MPAEYLIGALAVIVGSLVALSSFIIARKPESRALFAKIAPYQGFLGVGLLVYGVWQLLANLGDIRAWFEFNTVYALAWVACLVAAILLGINLGFGVIAGWIPGDGAAEQRGLAIQKKLLTYSLPIGLVGLFGGLITVYTFFTVKG